MSDKWTLGVLVGLPVWFIIILAIICCIGIGIFIWRDEGSVGFFVGSAISLVIAFIIIGITYWPWKTEYHKWMATEGVVTNMNKRLIPAGEHGMQERIVLVINGQQYGCDDTRCALVEKGDQIGLRCKKEFEWGSTSGYACRFVYNKSKGQS